MDRKKRAAFAAIEREVREAGDLAIIEMWRIREAGGWAKLGVNVIQALSNDLDEAGMGTLPPDEPLPLDGGMPVRVYRQRSNVGQIVDAVTRPTGRGDEALRRMAADDSSEILVKIRQLVGRD